MRRQSVIFDLDGTLINSAPSILSSLQLAFDELGINPIYPLTADLIGPPLAEVVSTSLGDVYRHELGRVIERFKFYYDDTGYRETDVFPGIGRMLKQLKSRSLKLYIATNKRGLPALQIIKHLQWSTYFEDIFSLDRYSPPLKDKSSLLRTICLELRRSGEELIYVGDRREDLEAADANKLPFILVSWGYSQSQSFSSKVLIAQTPDELQFMVSQM